MIENPIINSPFAEPTRHFRFDEDGLSAEVVEGRRQSTYFVPIPRSRAQEAQLSMEDELQERESGSPAAPGAPSASDPPDPPNAPGDPGDQDDSDD